MAKPNYTYSVQQAPPGGDLNVSIVVTDAAGRQVIAVKTGADAFTGTVVQRELIIRH